MYVFLCPVFLKIIICQKCHSDKNNNANSFWVHHPKIKMPQQYSFSHHMVPSSSLIIMTILLLRLWAHLHNYNPYIKTLIGTINCTCLVIAKDYRLPYAVECNWQHNLQQPCQCIDSYIILKSIIFSRSKRRVNGLFPSTQRHPFVLKFATTMSARGSSAQSSRKSDLLGLFQDLLPCISKGKIAEVFFSGIGYRPVIALYISLHYTFMKWHANR